MNDVEQRRRQRAELDASIARDEEALADTFNTHLEALSDAVDRLLRDRELAGEYSERKNVSSVTVSDRIRVDFGRIENEYSGFLAVSDLRTGMVLRTDPGPLPTESALLGLLAGMLDGN